MKTARGGDAHFLGGRVIIKCKKTKELFEKRVSREYDAITEVACRKLDMLDAAADLRDLRVPPGNRLEALSGDRDGQHSIRINAKWRICFVWDKDRKEAYDVEIVDYH